MLDLLPLWILVVALLLVMAYWVPHWRMYRRVGSRLPAPCDVLPNGSEHAMLYFFSPRCGRCRVITPLVDELERRGERVIRVDVNNQPEPVRRFQVRVVPAVLVVDQARISRVLVGPGMAAQLRQQIDGLPSGDTRELSGSKG